MLTTSPKLLDEIWPIRHKTAHKYDYGHLLVISGNRQFAGAPALVSLAALRTGADVLTLAAPKRAADIAATFSPSIITYPLNGDFLMEKHFDELIKLTNKKTAIALGPGLGRESQTLKVIQRLTASTKLPIVIDADGIYAFNKKQETINKKQKIFTPHIREFKALTGIDVADMDEDDKAETVKKSAKKLNTTIILKGSTDIISDGNQVCLNKTGSPYMTSGGTGDVLCGIIGAVAAILQTRGNFDAFKAACIGAYISGASGELAAKKYKDSLIATDVIEEISNIK